MKKNHGISHEKSLLQHDFTLSHNVLRLSDRDGDIYTLTRPPDTPKQADTHTDVIAPIHINTHTHYPSLPSNSLTNVFRHFANSYFLKLF